MADKSAYELERDERVKANKLKMQARMCASRLMPGSKQAGSQSR